MSVIIPIPSSFRLYKSWATLGCITAEMNECLLKGCGVRFLMSNFLSTSHAVKEVEGGGWRETKMLIEPRREVSLDDCKEYWQNWELSCSKTVFSFAYCLELSHVLNIILVKFRKERPSFILDLTVLFLGVYIEEKFSWLKKKKMFF